MTTHQKNKTAVASLLMAGKKAEEQVREIKSVAEQGSLASVEPTVTTTENNTEKENTTLNIQIKDQTKQSEGVESKKKFEDFLVRKEYKDTENVRVPRSLHRQLKLIATASGCTMTQIVGNLLEDFYNTYPKEILACKKKLLQD